MEIDREIISTDILPLGVIQELLLSIAPDKRGIHKILLIFLHENICCGYSLEVPQRGTSNEYPQHMFSWRNMKIISIFLVEKTKHLFWSYGHQLLMKVATQILVNPQRTKHAQEQCE